MSLLSVERENGLPISYACRGADRQHNLTLSFEYEFAVTDPAEDIGAEVIQQMLPALEYYILYYVAEAVGVLTCDFASQNILKESLIGGSLGMDVMALEAAQRTTVVGISNVDPDEWRSNKSELCLCNIWMLIFYECAKSNHKGFTTCKSSYLNSLYCVAAVGTTSYLCAVTRDHDRLFCRRRRSSPRR